MICPPRFRLLIINITLNSESKAGVQWWLDFLPDWNGASTIQSEPVTSASLSLFTDASGAGFGAVFGSAWFSAEWPQELGHHHINVKELFAIVAAVCTWGQAWHDQQVLFFTDNLSITQVWLTGSSRYKDIMRLVRFLFLFSARLNLNILMQHDPGLSNSAADALSRLQVWRFHRLVPHANQTPSPVAPEIWSILTQ